MSFAEYEPSPSSLRTLFDVFWTRDGWRPHRRDVYGEYATSADLQAAVAAGVLFLEPRSLSHDGWVTAAKQAVAKVGAEEVEAAFLASLSTRRLDLRSSLASYVVASSLPEHSFRSRPNQPDCPVCFTFDDTDGRDLNVLNFERFKWGGVRRDDIVYVAFDLEQFRRAPRPPVSSEDIAIGHELIRTLRSLPVGTTAPAAAKALGCLPGSRAEREVLLDILGICSILEAPGHPGHLPKFVAHDAREVPPHRFVDRAYPVCWWRSEHGVNDRALAAVLPLLA